MEMTKEEIVRKYNNVEHKKGYIQILADLNGCDKKDIVEILREAGVSLPGNPNFSNKTVYINAPLPDVVRDQLNEDLKFLESKIATLSQKHKAIREFLEASKNES